MLRSLISIWILVAALALPASAEVAREITWDDLVPKVGALRHPFAGLPVATRENLGEVARARLYLEREIVTEESQQYRNAMELEKELLAEGVDVDGLITKAVAFADEVERRNTLVVGELEGLTVRIPGYALPLEYSETGVKEFLLVPYVGACIHTPPPPANQIVYVELDETFKADDLYTPVWITGKMKVQQSKKSLSFVDGNSDVQSGYTLTGISVEPYE